MFWGFASSWKSPNFKKTRMETAQEAPNIFCSVPFLDHREQYSRKIQEQENLGKGLREKQKMVKENHEPSLQQMKMWKDFERLLEMKLRLKHGGGGMGGGRGAVVLSLGKHTESVSKFFATLSGFVDCGLRSM